MYKSKEQYFVYGSLLIILLVMAYLAVTANGTGDWGDAIYHYLYSRYAFQHPENFLNHWAKPVYVLFTAPIAQGGFTAVKFFNIGMLLSSIWLAWQVGKHLEIDRSWLVVLLMATAPMTGYQTLSGLTEPMFACWMMLGIFGLVKEKYIVALLWLSFLPFVRSEGLIVFCVLFLYLLIKRKWYLLPLLTVGHIIYGIIGYFYYGDFLWIFNKMSYATLDGAYGSGPFWQFADKMHTVIGDFQPVLLIICLLTGLVSLIQYWRGKGLFSIDKLWLVYGIAVAYFLAHSIFWYFGIFNSFGLLRVMIGVLPLFALIMIEGINTLISFFPITNRTTWEFSFLGLLIITLFFYYHKKINYKFHFFQNAAQEGQNQLVEKHLSNYPSYTYFFDAIHLALPLEADWFDPNIHRTTPQLFTGEPIPNKSLIFWDNIFSGRERKIPLEQLKSDKRFTLIDCLETGTWENPKPKTCLFEFDSTYANSPILLKKGFELVTDTIARDSSFAKSGKYSRILNKQYPYSSSFSGFINSFQQDNAHIRVTCWVYLNNAVNAFHSPPQVIISFESSNKSFGYHAAPLFQEGDQKGAWKYITFEQPVPKYKLFHDRVKTYIWNPTNIPVYVDDLEVSWFMNEKNK